MARHTVTTETVQTIEAALAEMAAEQTAAAERIAALRAELRLARGTADVTEAARAAAAPAPAPPLPDRVEAALRAGIWSLDELCHEVRAPAGPVSAALKRARTARQVYNVGAEDRPRWTWVPGDAVETQALYAHVERLISERPFEFAELLAATGARRGRVSGAIVSFQHAGRRVLNLGTTAKARWFLLPAKNGARR